MKKTPRAETAAEQLLKKYKWRPVVAPQTWRPTIGDELVGFYGGRTLRNGQHGQYEVVIVHVPFRGAITVSGVSLINLIDAAVIPVGHPVRIRYMGLAKTKSEHERKVFELAVAEDLTPIAEGDLPRVEPS